VNSPFRKVSKAAVGDAHAIYLGVYDWLKTKGVRQWLRASPEDAFAEFQRKGQLFAYYIDDRMAAVVIVAFEATPYWAEVLGGESRWWIKSLAVDRVWHGAGIGPRVLAACESFIQEAGATQAYLDCVGAGFLPGYYAGLGYETLARKEITYPSGNTFAMALMTKRLANQEAAPTRAHLTLRANSRAEPREDGTPCAGPTADSGAGGDTSGLCGSP